LEDVLTKTETAMKVNGRMMNDKGLARKHFFQERSIRYLLMLLYDFSDMTENGFSNDFSNMRRVIGITINEKDMGCVFIRMVIFSKENGSRMLVHFIYLFLSQSRNVIHFGCLYHCRNEQIFGKIVFNNRGYFEGEWKSGLPCTILHFLRLNFSIVSLVFFLISLYDILCSFWDTCKSSRKWKVYRVSFRA
jgi:hypothetical protein